MSLEPIHIIQYNGNDDEWWAGRSAVVCGDVKGGSGISLPVGERVTIVRKVASGVQVGHSDENRFEVRPSSRTGLFKEPCTSLSLTNG